MAKKYFDNMPDVDRLAIQTTLKINKVQTVYTVGDSIFSNSTFTIKLQELIGGDYSVINANVAGDNTVKVIRRLKPSIINNNDANYTIVLVGINDINQNAITAGDLKIALQSIYTELFEAGIKVIAITMTPYKGHVLHTVDRQAIVDEVNAWILNTAINVYARINLYAELEDPANEDALLPAYSSDLIHLSLAGQYAAAEFIVNSVVLVEYDEQYDITVTGDSKINQDVSSSGSPTFKALNINPSFDKNHIQEDGVRFYDENGNVAYIIRHDVYNVNGVALNQLIIYSTAVNDAIIKLNLDGSIQFKERFGPFADATIDIGADGIRYRDLKLSRYLYATGGAIVGSLLRASLSTYADNAAALAGGKIATDMYKTATGEVRIVV